jgi:hypothetical protein
MYICQTLLTHCKASPCLNSQPILETCETIASHVKGNDDLAHQITIELQIEA